MKNEIGCSKAVWIVVFIISSVLIGCGYFGYHWYSIFASACVGHTIGCIGYLIQEITDGNI